ncbi:hypothetical protein PQC55_gp121 [Escherichia phage vB_EcoP-CHD5UKE1]|uniref:Uncharacterized protein n=1 Tax=Escherichia phage vB_EcoP-CHD5UKE1 TaxID=2865805 RepID=A0ABX9AFN7_9CAUD|nr:hypothetical protein PQC55_gp121 [Escherichia phage vB_EcoP-CHD5UKE1]QZI80637.1 hypothetical protein CHD5UKE1_141 [Escherichia phage vB_EcoP-CHD5UKE1]
MIPDSYVNRRTMSNKISLICSILSNGQCLKAH